MLLNLLRALISHNKDFVALLQRSADELKSAFWIEDIDGKILYGTKFESPSEIFPIEANGEPLGSIRGSASVAIIGSWINQYLKQEAARKLLGAEVLHLYREINFMFGFAEKLATIAGIEEIAQLTLRETKQLIRFDQGIIISFSDSPSPFKILATSGDSFEEDGLQQELMIHPTSPVIRKASAQEATWIMSAPLKVNDQRTGGIYLQRNAGEEFSAAELKLLTSIAFQSGAAIETALQYQSAADRMVELEKEKLESDSLRNLDELKSRFYSNITHEFRTPLTIILGMTGLPDGSNITIEERFDMILRNGKGMLTLVDQLLDLAKLETTSLPLRKTSIDVILFAKQIISSFNTFAKTQDIQLEFSSTLEHKTCEIDADKLQQVISNLLSNAIKFSRPGALVKLTLFHTDDQVLHFSVEDSGKGIPAADLPYVFERFFQSDHTNAEIHPGSGIGLSHARELVRLMGGDITVESEVNAGTKFSFWIPCTETETSGISYQTDEVDLPIAFHGELPLILLIEDNPDMMKYIRACLASGYHLEVASNGLEGIAKAIEIVPDIILSDVMMPGADGFEVTSTLKKDERTSHIPIILLTARADVSDKLAGLRHGADVYLGKPFQLEELQLNLSNLLVMRRQLQRHYAGKVLNNGAVSIEMDTQEDPFILKLKSLMEEHLADENFALPDLCMKIGMSRSQLFRKMKALINEAPSSFIRTYRLHRAKELLIQTEYTVAEIAYRVGFRDPAYFSFAFNEAFGQTPSSTRSL